MRQTAIILQARSGSTRLPGKMLLPFYENKGILEILLERLIRCMTDTRIIVATSDNARDDGIAEIANNVGVLVYRGDESDVLQRFIDAAEHYGIRKIIRVCADNLFLDMLSLEKLVEKFEDSSKDYISFITHSGTPSIKTHYGFWAEAVSLEALYKVRESTEEALYHEHVTNFIYSNSQKFLIEFLPIDSIIDSNADLRLTMDTIDDFNSQQQIYSYLIRNKEEISPANIIAYLNNHIELYEIMRRTIQANNK